MRERPVARDDSSTDPQPPRDPWDEPRDDAADPDVRADSDPESEIHDPYQPL